MKIERIQGNEERRILTAMIVDNQALGRISTKWDGEMFRSRWADIVGDWCVKYHRRYGRAPQKHVQGLFESWASEGKDKETIQLVERFLTNLSEDYKQAKNDAANSDFIVDLAAKHFTRVKLRRTTDRVSGFVDEGKLDKAVEEWTKFHAVELGMGAAIDVLHNQEAVRAAFEEEAEDILVYPGALGTFFKGQMARDSFIALLAPEKRGKTFWLIDMGWRAMLQRRRVAWFAAGDMSEKQMIRRLAARAARHPVRSKEWPATVKYPIKMRRTEDGTVQVKFEEKTFDRPLSWRAAWKAFQEVAQYRVKGKDYLRLSVHPNSTLSVKGIDAQLEAWAREGWVPDVVITDYADILDEDSAMPGAQAPRDKINASWKQQRALSQKWHILYITATQADAEGGVVDIIRRTNFSEDKRKLAHVTGMLGINQSSEEKDKGVFRLNWVVLREGEFSESATVAVASCLPLASPAVKSCF